MKVLSALPNYRNLCPDGIRLLKENGCELVINELGRPMGFGDLKDIVADVDGVVAGVDVWDEKLLSLAPKLKAIARFGVGVDNLDLKACERRGITVTNCPGVNTNSVAEHALMLILGLLRHLGECDRSIREGRWSRVMHHELRGQTVGLLGFGSVGRSLCEKLEPFHVRVLAYDKYPDEKAAAQLGVKLTSQNEVLAQADILSLHTPATPETAHMINRDTIGLMKSGVMLINTARGSVVDEAAVYAAMKEGKVAGYGTDVFDGEPPAVDNPLFSMQQYLCTPHVAAESYENWTQTGVITAQALLDVFSGRVPQHKLV
ncbi:phosphoglycerate dehydrogenase [Caproiciproducens sp. NJN-50]|uniref:phosphoglycerate dehydrogenase n=1 Tax=Acutalibacteraceae TaxID=3082771 RepID=UPI000FFE2CC9|nr:MULTISPECIES: phosphoglycerate dehydrogenase [Acutalibacteraceae]QAT50724.1 phosphoglycerate dehydrogenase [Caproiciproducens sp. NJN-50]